MAKVIEWNPEKGDALQGDVILFKVPKGFKLDRSNEVQRKDFGLVLAEGEVTGHHHAIWNRNPATFRRANEGEGGTDVMERAPNVADAIQKADEARAAEELMAHVTYGFDPKVKGGPATVGTARLFKDDAAVRRLIQDGQLVQGSESLAIGFLVVEGQPVDLQHDEHDTIKIPPGCYYVGGQREFDAAQARRVAD